MNIRVRTSSGRTKPETVKIREKIFYACQDCKNRYYDHHILCPQCLGMVSTSSPQVSDLTIISSPETRSNESVELLQTLSGNQDFDFRKALKSLPWKCIRKTDRPVLQHWKECLEAEGLDCEIAPALEEPKRRSGKMYLPLFKDYAPLPAFLPAATTEEAKQFSRSIENAAVRMRWVEIVLKSFTLLEELFKQRSGRILFYDIIFRIDHQIHETTVDFSSARLKDALFEKRISKLRESLQQWESEIKAVRESIEEQL